MTMNKTKLKKELSLVKQKLKEASREYDRVACRSINPDVELAVSRAKATQQELMAKVSELSSRLASLSAKL